MEAVVAAQQHSRAATSAEQREPALTRNQKAKRRKRLLRQFNLEGSQDSHCSDAATDLSAFAVQSQQIDEQQQQPQPRKRPGSAPPIPGPKRAKGKASAQAIAVSTDSTALRVAVPAAQAQSAAQLSSATVHVLPAGATGQQQQAPQQQEQTLETQRQLSRQVARPGVHSGSARQDWSQAAAVVAGALMQQAEEAVAVKSSSKTAAICRHDLSHAALLIAAMIGGTGSQSLPAATQPVPIAAAPKCSDSDAWPGDDISAEDAVPCPAAEAAAAAVVPSSKRARYGASSQRQQSTLQRIEERVEEAAAQGAVEAAAGCLQGGECEQDAAAAAAASIAAETSQVLRANGRTLYVHGNYHGYYGYRLGEAFTDDPRLAALERRWFAGRRCMDVGCNEGLVTLALATRFGVKSMVGVDIDNALIVKACTHVREERQRAEDHARAVRAAGTPAADRRAAKAVSQALARTWFVHGDVLASEAQPSSLDTITCLSVSKWVHLHHGDAGLRALFEKFARLLVPGGLLVLEPQPWRSYKAAAVKVRRSWPRVPQDKGQGEAEGEEGREVERVAVNPLPHAFFHRLDQLRLRPEGFADLLCKELGFRLLRQLQVGSSTQGFDRPLLVFRKQP